MGQNCTLRGWRSGLGLNIPSQFLLFFTVSSCLCFHVSCALYLKSICVTKASLLCLTVSEAFLSVRKSSWIQVKALNHYWLYLYKPLHSRFTLFVYHRETRNKEWTFHQSLSFYAMLCCSMRYKHLKELALGMGHLAKNISGSFSGRMVWLTVQLNKFLKKEATKHHVLRYNKLSPFQYSSATFRKTIWIFFFFKVLF